MKVTRDAISNILKKQEERQPLIHCISNDISLNDLAQTIAFYNGTPIISHSIEEICEITPMSKVLLINLGTLDCLRLRAIEQAVKLAHRKRIPIIFDLVGVQVSFFRREVIFRLISRYEIDVIKGSLVEIKALIDGITDDKPDNTQYTQIDIKDNCELREKIRLYAKKYKIIAVVTGMREYITDGFSEFFITNADKRFTKIVSLNCILGGMIAVGLGIADSKEEKVQATITAVEALSVCEELALKKLKECEGIFTLKQYLLDEISKITDEKIHMLGNMSYEFKR